MPQTATIKNLQEAFEVVKAMRTEGLDWSEGYRPLSRRVLAEIMEGREGRKRCGNTSFYARGLTGEGPEMICVDGGQGSMAALTTVGIPVQRR